MTRPNFYEGIHPQLDPDIAERRRDDYMAELEQQRDDLHSALERIVQLPRRQRTGKKCYQIARDTLAKGAEE